ncbi:hypothetical protein C8F00_1714 [Xanthomonas vasicola]
MKTARVNAPFLFVGALKPLSRRGGKALLARHWRACLGAPAPQAPAGARSGGWGEGTSQAQVLFQVHVASHVRSSAPSGSFSPMKEHNVPVGEKTPHRVTPSRTAASPTYTRGTRLSPHSS